MENTVHFHTHNGIARVHFPFQCVSSECVREENGAFYRISNSILGTFHQCEFHKVRHILEPIQINLLITEQSSLLKAIYIYIFERAERIWM